MVKKYKQKGGLNKILHPEMYSYTHGASNAREQASIMENINAEKQHNLVHGHKQNGGADCTGGPAPQPPTFGVQQGPGHMNSNTQSTVGYNNTCQNIANRALDGSNGKLPPPQKGGTKRKKNKYIKRKNKKNSNTKKTHLNRYKRKSKKRTTLKKHKTRRHR